MSIELINGHVLLPELPDWQQGAELTRRWETEIQETVTGAEDRGAMRAVPRLELSYEIATLTQEQRARLEDQLREAMKSGKAVVPFWGRASDLASSASGTSAELATTNWPWQVGDFIFFLDASDIEKPVYAVRQITAKTGLVLTLNSVLPQTFAAGSLVWPLLFGKPDGESMSLVTSRHGSVSFTLLEVTGSTRATASSAPTYLSRPIFTTPINWTDGASQRLSYDLRELAIGFGAEVFAPLQSHVVHGFEFSVQLNTETEILALENFFAALRGRLHGFWLPAPTEAVDIVEGISTTQFDIAGQGFAASWNDHPAVHLWFTQEGTGVARKILSVADNGDGTERVTLESALTFTPNAETMVSRLHYVRLAEDEESAAFLAEWFEQRSFQVLELPVEYAAAETGEMPVYLYHVWINTDPIQHWYYTSFASGISSLLEAPEEDEPVAYISKPIDHGSLDQGLKGEAEKVTIEAVHETGHPFVFGFPYPPTGPIYVRIFETSFADPDAGTVLFTGQVEKVTRRGKKISASCISRLDLDNQRLPDALISPRCSFQVYEPNTCKVVKTTQYRRTAALSVINGSTVRVSHVSQLSGLPVNYFSFGWIEAGTGSQMEIRTVLEDTIVGSGVRELKLNLPLLHATVGTSVVLLAGCDGRWTTCKIKFVNDRFFGHPFVPEKNPTLVAVQSQVSQGGKK
ncbi:MAG TPA: phage BR0599 family protein [Verrucomicrobiae bacterium]